MIMTLFSRCKSCIFCSKPVFSLTYFLLLLLFFFSVNINISHCSPPEDPIKCTNSQCTITNSYGSFPDRSTCRAATAFFPSSEEELISVVASAAKNKKKMKVATRYSHSIPKLVCSDGNEGVLISTKNLNHILKVDSKAGMMTVESGLLLQDLIEAAAKAGLALPYSPYWSGVTVGGMLGTGAHGSSLWGKGPTVHDYVVELRIVSPVGPKDGYVRVRTLNESDPDLDAARVNLGVLGVVSQVTFKLEPLFKRSISYITKDDFDLGDEALTFGKQHEFGDMTWYPSQHKVVYRIDDRVPITTPGDGLYDATGFRPTLSLLLAAIRSLEEGQESSRDAEGKCVSARVTTLALNALAFGLTNNGIVFTGYPVIGYQHRIQASGSCLNSLQDALITTCIWDPRVKGEFYFQTTITIGMPKVKPFIQDIQTLVSLLPKSLCGLDLYNGILMRYVTASPAYLGKEENGVEFDITYYRSKDPRVPRLYEDVLEEIEQMAVFKYGGLPHWGKNRNVGFEGVIKKYKNGKEFIRVKERFDPLGLFSSDWTDRVLGLGEGVSVFKDGCALEGLCICYQDSHCAPSHGYFCRPGRIYKEARVCSRNTLVDD